LSSKRRIGSLACWAVSLWHRLSFILGVGHCRRLRHQCQTKAPSTNGRPPRQQHREAHRHRSGRRRAIKTPLGGQSVYKPLSTRLAAPTVPRGPAFLAINASLASRDCQACLILSLLSGPYRRLIGRLPVVGDACAGKMTTACGAVAAEKSVPDKCGWGQSPCHR